MSLMESLEALVAEHDRIGSPLRDELRPGTDRGRVEEAVRSLGLDPHLELVHFFAWHDLEARPGSPGVDWFCRPAACASPKRSTITAGASSWRRVARPRSAIARARPAAFGAFTGFWRTDCFRSWAGARKRTRSIPGRRGSTPGALWRVSWHPNPDFQTAMVASSLTEFIDRVVDLFRSDAYRWDAAYQAIVTVDEVFALRGLGATMRP